MAFSPPTTKDMMLELLCSLSPDVPTTVGDLARILWPNKNSHDRLDELDHLLWDVVRLYPGITTVLHGRTRFVCVRWGWPDIVFRAQLYWSIIYNGKLHTEALTEAGQARDAAIARGYPQKLLKGLDNGQVKEEVEEVEGRQVRDVIPTRKPSFCPRRVILSRGRKSLPN